MRGSGSGKVEPRIDTRGRHADHDGVVAGEHDIDRDDLEERDILFIDSSHQLKPGSDVEFLLQKALPRLAKGVRVHFHDIFLPDPYPFAWAWRRYNEQQAVAPLIGNGYALEFASHQVRQMNGVLARLPLKDGAIESSLWLRKL